MLFGSAHGEPVAAPRTTRTDTAFIFNSARTGPAEMEMTKQEIRSDLQLKKDENLIDGQQKSDRFAPLLLAPKATDKQLKPLPLRLLNA